MRLLREGDQREDHVARAATRLLMALTLRELGSWVTVSDYTLSTTAYLSHLTFSAHTIY